ncbi:MAG: RNA-guided endonuclease TnpB family protein [Vulcanibacillus sp.]
MKRNKAFKVRIYPTQKQKSFIDKTLGCTRFIYNQMLGERIQTCEELKDDRRKLYDFKYKTEKDYKQEFDFLKEADAKALQQSRIDLSHAYTNFFNSLKGKRKGEKVGFPKFKKRKNGSSYRTINCNNYTDIQVSFDNSKIKLPKVGWIKFSDGRTELNGLIKSATVSKTCTGKYFVSILYEYDFEYEGMELTDDLKIKGLDCSLSNFYVDELGNSPDYVKRYRKYEKKLAKAQRRVSRKQKGSKNRHKAQMKVNKIHEKISSERDDFVQKLSTKLANENDVIVVENLSIKGIAKAMNFGKSMNDLGYSKFLHCLEYKMLDRNKLFVRADRFFASSKTCSYCGYVKKDLTLSDIEWECPSCKTKHNRDRNAGQNLVNYGFNFLGLMKPEVTPLEIKASELKDLSLIVEEGNKNQNYINLY